MRVGDLYYYLPDNDVNAMCEILEEIDEHTVRIMLHYAFSDTGNIEVDDIWRRSFFGAEIEAKRSDIYPIPVTPPARHSRPKQR